VIESKKEYSGWRTALPIIHHGPKGEYHLFYEIENQKLRIAIVEVSREVLKVVIED